VIPGPPHANRGAFAFRILCDAYLDADARYWRRRAEQLEAARPRRGDFNGQATVADLLAAGERLTEAAQACRNRAAYVEASIAEFTHTISDLAQPSIDQVLHAERRLREALDAGDRSAIRRWSAVLDASESAEVAA